MDAVLITMKYRLPLYHLYDSLSTRWSTNTKNIADEIATAVKQTSRDAMYDSPFYVG
jgi:hypothetical protein